MESFRTLCDVSSNQAIGKVAEMLRFADASSFGEAEARGFGDCLRARGCLSQPDVTPSA